MGITESGNHRITEAGTSTAAENSAEHPTRNGSHSPPTEGVVVGNNDVDRR